MKLKTLFLVVIVCGCFTQNIKAQGNAHYLDSLDAASEKLRKFPDNIDLRLKKASWNMMLQQWEYAQKEYDAILKRDSNNVAALYYRAYTYEKLHRYKYARRDYETMLKIVPGNFNGMLGLALLCQKDMHYTEAMNLINQLIQLHPDSAVAYAARGGMELERNMLELAEYDYGEAMKRAPEDTDFILNRANVRLKLGRRREAKEDLDLAVKKGVPRPALAEWYSLCKE